MTWTTKHKAYAGIVVLGVAIVAFDQFVLAPGGASPSEAAAQSPAPPASSPASSKATTSASRRDAPPDIPAVNPALKQVTQSLRSAAARHAIAPGQTKDAFQVSPAWVGVTAPAHSAKPVAPLSPAESAAQAFKKTRALSAVLSKGNRPAAVVDGHLVYVGGSLEQARLVAVTERSAEFEIAGVRVRLFLPHANR